MPTRTRTSRVEKPAPRKWLHHPGVRLAFLAGAIGIGFFLFDQNPRDVTLVYAFDSGAVAPGEISVEILRGDDRIRIRRAELSNRSRDAQIRHSMQLPKGSYRVRARWNARQEEREVTVEESGTIVVPL